MCNTSKPLKDFNQYWMMVTSRLECLRNAKTVPPNLFDIQYRGTGSVIDSVFNEQAVGANSIDKESATDMLEKYSKGNQSLLNASYHIYTIFVAEFDAWCETTSESIVGSVAETSSTTSRAGLSGQTVTALPDINIETHANSAFQPPTTSPSHQPTNHIIHCQNV
ncbi:hypothetical protein OUZ56_010341 [Daphnia magna]|uniref:Uncharacterized protein n=1 Tax=Daphnia magna TaxID=35525 RepID=A0ABR0AI95_9CRUS|nr:hypothetical protein OUZ56_010341 [Daphnia magna]